MGEGHIDQSHSVNEDCCYEGERGYMEPWGKRQRERTMGQLYKLGGMTLLVNEFVLNHIHNQFHFKGLQ